MLSLSPTHGVTHTAHTCAGAAGRAGESRRSLAAAAPPSAPAGRRRDCHFAILHIPTPSARTPLVILTVTLLCCNYAHPPARTPLVILTVTLLTPPLHPIETPAQGTPP